MDADLDTLATALYATIDDLLKERPGLAPARPQVGTEPEITDAELITLAVLGVTCGHETENGWLRYARTHLHRMFPYLPQQSGYNKRLRNLTVTMWAVMRHLARQTQSWCDDLWVVDSTPVECGRSRQTALRSDLAGFAEYGYCASHSRYFWGVRLHLLATSTGLPVAVTIAPAKADERAVLLGMLEADPELHRPGQALMGDKNYFGRDFETAVAAEGFTLIRPQRSGEKPRAGRSVLKAFRQVIESTFYTFKGQLSLERHHAKTLDGLMVRMAQRVLALTVAIWLNEKLGQPIPRSVIAYDH